MYHDEKLEELRAVLVQAIADRKVADRAGDPSLTSSAFVAENVARSNFTEYATGRPSLRIGAPLQPRSRRRRRPRPTSDAHRYRYDDIRALRRRGLTLEEIGEQHGISRERVRQILSSGVVMPERDDPSERLYLPALQVSALGQFFAAMPPRVEDWFTTTDPAPA